MNQYEAIGAFVREYEPTLVAVRRDFHRHPEPGWTEYRTAAKIAERMAALGYEIEIGQAVLADASRMGLPTPKEAAAAYERAVAEGAPLPWVEKLKDSHTALVATMHFDRPGPTVAFRCEMDSNETQETDDPEHVPNREGFASLHPGAMHACGHDAHMSMALGLAKYIATRRADFAGTVKFLFQPAEEGVRGARAMRDAGVADDIDILFGIHVGLNQNESGTLACRSTGFLATSKLDAIYTGKSAHAGASPEAGRNALLAAATAVLNLQAISRTSAGVSRINVGTLVGGTGRNVVPDRAVLKLETRGETSAIDGMMKERALRILKAAGEMQDVAVEVREAGAASSAPDDASLGVEVETIAKACGCFDRVDPTVNFGASEDCAYFMERVAEHGGRAVYMGLGMDLKGPHHSSVFDVDEKVMPKGMHLLCALAERFLGEGK